MADSLWPHAWTAACQASLSSVFQSLLTFMLIESVMPSHHLILCRPLLLPSIFPSSRVFSMSWLFTSGSQSIEASASVLPVNIHGWFLLGLICLISLQSKELSRVFSSTHNSKASIQPLWSNSHICTWLLDRP